jgi:hypothetical protein
MKSSYQWVIVPALKESVVKEPVRKIFSESTRFCVEQFQINTDQIQDDSLSD